MRTDYVWTNIQQMYSTRDTYNHTPEELTSLLRLHIPTALLFGRLSIACWLGEITVCCFGTDWYARDGRNRVEPKCTRRTDLNEMCLTARNAAGFNCVC